MHRVTRALGRLRANKSYTFVMGQPLRVDLTHSSFDDFVSFLFDRVVSSAPGKRDPWYWRVKVDFRPETICAHYIRLFQQPEFLLTRFTKSQLEEGFWAIQGPNLDCSVYQIIYDSDLPLLVREECVLSMEALFTRLFANENLDTSVSMWWDSLCYDWHCSNRSRERGGEDERLQDVFFQVLSSLLSTNSANCQGAALHGLGHLHHPDTPQLINRYIQENPSLSKESKAYALAAARFEVM